MMALKESVKIYTDGQNFIILLCTCCDVTMERKPIGLNFSQNNNCNPLFSIAVTGGLQCYIDVEAKTIVTCNELEGFKTCFIKYNDSKCHLLTKLGN